MSIYHNAKCWDASGMDIYAIRKQNLLTLMAGRTQRTCADRWETSPSTLSQIVSKNPVRNLGDDLARKIEQAEGLQVGWFDHVHGAGAPAEPARHEQAEVAVDDSAEPSAQDARGTSFAEPQAARLITKAFADGLLKGDDLDEIARMARHLIRKNAASAAVTVPEHLEGLAEAAIRAAEAGGNPADMLKMIGHGLKKAHAKEDKQPDANPSKKRNS